MELNLYKTLETETDNTAFKNKARKIKLAMQALRISMLFYTSVILTLSCSYPKKPLAKKDKLNQNPLEQKKDAVLIKDAKSLKFEEDIKTLKLKLKKAQDPETDPPRFIPPQ